MRHYLSYALLVIACVTFCYTFFLSEAGEQVKTLQNQLKMQNREKQAVSSRVRELNRTLVGIESDPDALERLAREELKLMAEDEELIIFEKRQTAEGE